MPELPEVESIRRALAPIVGRTVVKVEIFRTDVIEGLPRGVEQRQNSLLVGGRIIDLLRHGKQLGVETDNGRTVCIQLGMSGQVLRCTASTEPRKHDHVVWTLDDRSTLTFRDPRRFGGLTVGDAGSLKRRWQDLGPDGLTLSDESLAAALTGRNRAVKAVLLDQALIAGVGNIYADEALFMAGIRPARNASRVRGDEVPKLAQAIRTVLAKAVEARGSSLRDYVQPDGVKGEAVLLHQAYGRGGLPCIRCGAPLRKTTIAQRTTVFCAECQR